MPPFYVIGHKNPDTDAICSAIGYAALLRAVGEEPKAIAARCGEISQRTKWVLERAGLDAPLLLTDVRVNTGMICHRKVIKVNVADTFLTAYRRMLNAEIRCVPVEDDEGNLCGILRYFDLLKLLQKEDIVPANADRWMFLAAPAIIFTAARTSVTTAWRRAGATSRRFSLRLARTCGRSSPNITKTINRFR